ncbi:MAG: hypothetical protein HKN18_03895 [Silicimonas sp.]|nr:hypothetical protein [Silicimonas sp.]
MALGILTVMSGGSVIFGSDQARTLAGDIVPFVVWFNFFAGFLYVFAGLAIWLRHRWALSLSIMIAGATALVAASFGIWVLSGGAYETRTAGALAFRFGVWTAIALILLRTRPPS